MKARKVQASLGAVSGLQVRRKGEALETVTTKSMIIQLLVAGGVEIAEGTLASGERITLIPAGSGVDDAVETYYLLSGKLARTGPEHRQELLGPGDYIVTRGLTEEVIFSAVEEVRFLYATTRPFFHEISQAHQELMRLAVEIEMKDGYTAEHCLRLQRLSFATGAEIGLSSHRLALLDQGAYLHDIGKVRVPLEILQKPAALTKAEWKVVKQHPIFGREMLEPTYVREAGPIVEQHHERLDGSGYPFGLAGDEILPEAYLVAIADTYDAMTTDRVYRKALPVAEAEAELRRYAGVHYPRELVSAFLSAVRRVEAQV
jgi:HD-GYP domain-containing protein (c-di-GMP phosphodiesterase class II)